MIEPFMPVTSSHRSPPIESARVPRSAAFQCCIVRLGIELLSYEVWSNLDQKRAQPGCLLTQATGDVAPPGEQRENDF